MADLVRNHSLEIQNRRSILGLDKLYLCFVNKSNTSHQSSKWFTLRRNNNDPSENIISRITSPYPPGFSYSSVIATGPEIFFFNIRSSYFWIFDSRSGTFGNGPRMEVERLYTSVGSVEGKLYVIGGDKKDETEAESFDLKNRVWEVAPEPKIGSHTWYSAANVSLGRKIYGLSKINGMNCYDTRDGSYERFELPNDNWWKTGVCVMQNVLYVYFGEIGLMWFDFGLMVWRVVDGLSFLKRFQCVGMAEYYGKLAFLWKRNVGMEKKEFFCTMIGLVRSKAGIRGNTVEPAQCIGTLSRNYRLQHCLSVSN